MRKIKSIISYLRFNFYNLLVLNYTRVKNNNKEQLNE
jgi:hypothetical protein